MTANDKLNAKIAGLTTDALKEISLRLTLSVTPEESIVRNRAERELAKRLTNVEFLAHMDACESMLNNDLTKAQLAFFSMKAEIDKMLADLQALSADNFKVPHDQAGWGHVGNLEYFAERLREIAHDTFGDKGNQ